MWWNIDLVALCNLFTLTNFIHAVSGGLGSAFSITVFYPLETARTRLQVDDKEHTRSSLFLIAAIVKKEGLHGLYRGWFSLVISLFLTNFTYFYVFHGLKALLCKEGFDQHMAFDLLFGCVAGSAAVLVTNPLWVVNTRLKLQGANLKSKQLKDLKRPKYNGIIHCTRTIAAYEGLGALWSGTVSSLLLVSNPAVQFMVYESLRRNLILSLGIQNLLSFIYFSNGAISKIVATVVTYPMQVVQTRMRAGYGEKNHNVFQYLYSIVKMHGVLGLFRGLESKLLQTVLTAALMFLAYERISAFVFSLVK